MTEARGTVFLDRDGVICEDRFPTVRSWERFEFLPRAKDALALLSKEGFRIFVATNKAAIGLGLLSERVNEEIHRRMVYEVAVAGGRIERVYHCPHAPWTRCDCRKPRAGMLERARREFGAAPRTSWMVGDRPKDVFAGRSFGARTIGVLTTFSRDEFSRRLGGVAPDFFAHDLFEAARIIVAFRPEIPLPLETGVPVLTRGPAEGTA
ncbi:MAG: D-glycero-alpha-D-manno-heptose-1,7-bisphosphate 7-phosphatase [Methanobacteriota archaeon]